MRRGVIVFLLTVGVAQSEGTPLDEEDLESIAEALDIFPPTSAGYASKARVQQPFINECMHVMPAEQCRATCLLGYCWMSREPQSGSLRTPFSCGMVKCPPFGTSEARHPDTKFWALWVGGLG